MPGGEPDVSYAYDNLSRLTSASQTGNALSFTYDALSRNLTQVGPMGTVSAQWDVAGRRTKFTYPGTGLFIDYDYLVTGETTKIRENGATSGVGVLATYAYDDFGRRTGITFGNGTSQAYTFDLIWRLASLGNELSGTANDLSATFAYNPASQIASTVRTGDAYAWAGHFNENKTGTANGLNQLTQVGAKSLTHDARGNVTAFGTKSFTYSAENLMRTGPNGTSLSYDPGMRLYETASGGTTQRYAYDGLDRIAEYDGSNLLQRRTVHGPGSDEPIVSYEDTGTTDRRFLSSDERGSIISVTDSSGALLGINRYDEYGNPQSTNIGTWGYTGQAWLPSVGVWYYKARDYDPELGRFLQTDPIDVAGGINLYAYVGNDPINKTDQFGLDVTSSSPNQVNVCHGITINGVCHSEEYAARWYNQTFSRASVFPSWSISLGWTANGIPNDLSLPQFPFQAKPSYCSSQLYEVGSAVETGGNIATGVGVVALLTGDPFGLALIAGGTRVSTAGVLMKGFAGSERDLVAGATSIVLSTAPIFVGHPPDITSALILESLSAFGAEGAANVTGSDPCDG